MLATHRAPFVRGVCAGQGARPSNAAARRAFHPVLAVHVNRPAQPLEAVVIGGGIAGLLTAHVLSEEFDRVTLIEKDHVYGTDVQEETFKETAQRRRGVPQITQPHQLIAGAMRALNSLMPGFRLEAIEKGAVDLDMGLHVHYFDYGGAFPRRFAGLKSLGVTRRFLEQCIRERVFSEGLQSEVLHVRDSTRVAEYLWDNDAVKGVVLDDGTSLRADLVVDASGRKSRTPEWLKERDLQAPEMIRVDPHVAVASRMVKMPGNWDQEWKVLMCKSQPYGKRGGSLFPTEGGMWQVTLAEINGPDVPRDDKGFLEFARSLPDPTMYEALRRSTPVSDVQKYNAMKNELLEYHKVEMPRGLVVVGDAVQRLNALYGQGMGVASQSVVLFKTVLHEALSGKATDAERREAVATLAEQFQPRLAESLIPAWTLATKADLKYNSTTAIGAVSSPTSVDHLLTDSLLTAAQKDPTARIYHKMLAVAHLTAPTSSLISDPGVLGATMKSAIGIWGVRKELAKVQVPPESTD